jgi:hypothetical protein
MKGLNLMTWNILLKSNMLEYEISLKLHLFCVVEKLNSDMFSGKIVARICISHTIQYKMISVLKTL